MSYRNRRIAKIIKEAVANILLKDLQDPNFGFVAVTRASVSADLKNATVYFSILGDKDQQERVFGHLNRAKGRIRHLLTKQVALRYLPELSFEIDTILQAEERVGKILDELFPNSKPNLDQTSESASGILNDEDDVNNLD
ncbi:MAG: 30S ribosome-binding factor RbfA [candidate division WOR-3 bacterium]